MGVNGRDNDGIVTGGDAIGLLIRVDRRRAQRQIVDGSVDVTLRQ